MKREIKFRAWVTINSFPNEMVYDWCKLGEHNHFFGVDTTNERPDIGEVLDVMQYTGLKEGGAVDGKELYFGDLMMAPSGKILEIVWHEEEMRIALSDGESYYGFNVPLYKLVGNIHQNPELL